MEHSPWGMIEEIKYELLGVTNLDHLTNHPSKIILESSSFQSIGQLFLPLNHEHKCVMDNIPYSYFLVNSNMYVYQKIEKVNSNQPKMTTLSPRNQSESMSISHNCHTVAILIEENHENFFIVIESSMKPYCFGNYIDLLLLYNSMLRIKFNMYIL